VSAVTAFLILASPLIGSFLGAASDRSRYGEDWVFRRSECPECKAKLRPFELVPIFSWIALRGRCGRCGDAIPLRYLLLEVVMGLLALWAWVAVPATFLVPTILLSWLLVALSVIDLREQRLPDHLNLAVFLLGVVAILLLRRSELTANIFAAAFTFAMMLGVEKLYLALRNRDGLGRGDVKLFAALAVWVGFQFLPHLLLIASSTALLFALVRQRIASGATPIEAESELPFGPFIAFAGWSVWLHLV